VCHESNKKETGETMFKRLTKKKQRANSMEAIENLFIQIAFSTGN
jgi:hypothetical protein